MKFLRKAKYIVIALAYLVAGCSTPAPTEIAVPKNLKTARAMVKEVRDESVVSSNYSYTPPVTGSVTTVAGIQAAQRVAASSQNNKVMLYRFRVLLVTKDGKEFLIPPATADAMQHATAAQYTVGDCFEVTYSDEDPRYIRTSYASCN